MSPFHHVPIDLIGGKPFAYIMRSEPTPCRLLTRTVRATRRRNSFETVLEYPVLDLVGAHVDAAEHHARIAFDIGGANATDR